MSKPLIIYHGGCQDGFGSALAAWMKFRKKADYLAASHGDLLPDVKNRDVYILDYSWKREQTIELHEKADNLLVLDHHVSAQKELEGLPYVQLDLTKSGARLAWEYFHPNTDVPELILYIEDRDLWKWQLPNSRGITAALETYPMRFHIWKKWLQDGVASLAQEGETILRYQEQMVAKITRKIDTFKIAGFEVPAVNCPILSSELGNVLCQKKPFAAVWRELNGLRTYSLRSDENGENVSLIAAAFGGGGHPQAAGFTVKAGTDVSQPIK